MTQAHLIRLDQLKRALDAGLIDQDTFDTAAAAINAHRSGSGAIAQGQDALAVGASGVGITGASQATITGISTPASSSSRGPSLGRAERT